MEALIGMTYNALAVGRNVAHMRFNGLFIFRHI